MIRQWIRSFLWFCRLVWCWLVEAYFDNTTGLAAQMAYEIVFLMAPGLLLVSGFLRAFGTDPKTLHTIIDILQNLTPRISRDIIEQQVTALAVTGASGRVAIFGLPFAIYLGTNLFNTISRMLNHCLGVKELLRPWWARPIISALLLFWFAFTLMFSFNAIVFGEQFAVSLGNAFDFHAPWLGDLIAALKYPIIALALMVLALTLYLVTPEIYQSVPQTLPGAVFFSVGWLTITTLFKVYTENFARYSETYLILASFIVLLTWAWVTSLLLLLGGRLNAVIARFWPNRPWRESAVAVAAAS